MKCDLDSPAIGVGAYRPLLAGHARWLAAGCIVLATITITAFGMRYANTDQHTPGWLDLRLDGFIRNHLSRDQLIIRTLASLGNPPQTIILVAAVASAAALARRWSGLLLTILGTITAITMTELVLKPLVGRLSYGHLSFPSGHTTAVTALALTTVILTSNAQWPRSIAARLTVSLAAAAVAISVAISLIAEHVHYATDTVAGSCVAVATVFTMALGFDFYALHVHQSTAADDQNLYRTQSKF